jgi:TRAP-type C4-dicarboxylate transport system permease small subunit
MKHSPKNFALGIVLIVASFVLAKISLIPLFVFPDNASWGLAITLYVFSWIVLIPGIYLAGREGYRLVKNKMYGRK